MRETIINKEENFDLLCGTVRALLNHNEYKECEMLVSDAMGKNPHSPQPHNLLGVILEKEGDHARAMKHFRAAWALDPTYLPARRNIDNYGNFLYRGRCVIDESDCREESAFSLGEEGI